MSAEIFGLYELVLMNGNKNAVGITFYDLKAVFHVGYFLVAQPLNAVIVDRNVAVAGIDDLIAAEFEQRSEILNDPKVYILFIRPVYPDAAAVSAAVCAYVLTIVFVYRYIFQFIIILRSLPISYSPIKIDSMKSSTTSYVSLST